MIELVSDIVFGLAARFIALFFYAPSRSIDRVDIDSIDCRFSRGFVSRWIPAARAIAVVFDARFDDCVFSLRWPDDYAEMVENIQVGRI